MDLRLFDSWRDGRWSARQVWDGEVPAMGELVDERLHTLAQEWPGVGEAELLPHAQAWASGWLSVANGGV